MDTKLLDQFDINTKENILSYLNGKYEKKSKDKLQMLIKTDPQRVKNAFYKTLSFGTGGIREIMDIGPNKLNKYTIRAATQGLSNYLKKEENSNISVVIGYDNRKNSKSFALEAAKVFAYNNIKVYLFEKLCPTPIVSFACREKNCSAAVMITASHNTKEYNGYKVYGEDGGQIVSPHDTNIANEIGKIKDPSQIEISDKSDPLIKYLSDEIIENYIEKLKCINSFNKFDRSELSIVYSSLHGTGIRAIPETLEKYGFTNIALVEKQCNIDEDFSNAPAPNPENKKALEMGIDIMLKENKDIFLATDPDADRLAIAINHNGKPIIFTGNQTASILADYLLQNSSDKSNQKKAVVKSIVTTELLSEIAKGNGADIINVLTGFKYIAEKMLAWEKNNEFKFIFGAEESLGYLPIDFVRDKDSISSAFLLCQIAAMQKEKNKTLLDYLYDIYKKYGVYRESLISINFEDGKKGMDKMNQIMDSLRENKPTCFANFQIEIIDDYLSSQSINLKTKKTSPIQLPKSNVLTFTLNDGSKVVIRPSGTEPKIKIYFGVFEKNKDNNAIEKTIKLCDTRLEALENVLKTYFKQ